jgi:hypothetical protein
MNTDMHFFQGGFNDPTVISPIDLTATSTTPPWSPHTSHLRSSTGPTVSTSGTTPSGSQQYITSASQPYNNPMTISSQPLNFDPRHMPTLDNLNHPYMTGNLPQFGGLEGNYHDFGSRNTTAMVPSEYSHYNTLPMHPVPNFTFTAPESHLLSQSMFTQPASEKASEPDSPSADYVKVEGSKAENPRRKKIKTEPASRQPSGHGFTTFRVETSPSSESDIERLASRKTGDKSRGGRQKGSHLPREKAEQVKERREKVACWTCALQRDTVSCVVHHYNEPNQD